MIVDIAKPIDIEYLCEATMSLVKCDAKYRSFYHRKYKKVNKYQHKRALTFTARKLV